MEAKCFPPMRFEGCGAVVTWGDSGAGGDASSVQEQLAAGVIGISSTHAAFAALKENGAAVTWGDPAIHWDIYGDATHDIFSSGTPAYRHNEKTNTAFFDGHVGVNEKEELWFHPFSRKKLERMWLPDITIK